MIKWIPFAMVRITIFYMSGVLSGIYLPQIGLERQAVELFIGCLILYFIGFILFKKTVIRSITVGFFGLSAVFLAGFINLLHQDESKKSDHLVTIDSIRFYQAKVITSPEEKENSWRMVIEVSAVCSQSGWVHASGKVIIYASKKSGKINLKYGDQILVRGRPLLLSPPGNPYEFDFKRFLSFRNIYHQQFIQADGIKVIRGIDQLGPIFFSQQARAWAVSKMKAYVQGEREQAIALALVLGVTDGLDNELQNAYSASGAMHVLAVSGLHVGIIYWMILTLLKPIRKFSWSEWVVALISLMCLWSYAFVTGLSPSVLRAVTMFSFMAISKPFSRSTNIYNTLAASAFILLLYNPYLIMSVGFQLSYLAVIGIVYLQKPIYQLWEPGNRFVDWCWNISCVSMAAQIATFALGLLYFHQFPVYFLFSNLFVIPGSFVVLVAGILLLAVSPFAPVASLTGWMLEWSIKILNYGVFAVEGLPVSLINGVFLSTLQCWILMSLIVALILLFEFRQFRYIFVAFLLVCFFSFIQWTHYIEARRIQFIVYRINAQGALEWRRDGKSRFYADSTLLSNNEWIRFHIRPSRVAAGVERVIVNGSDLLISRKGLRLFNFPHARVLWVDRKNAGLPDKVSVDYLIIGNNAVSSLKQLWVKVKFKQLILDSSNSMAYSKKILKEAEAEKIPVHAVLTQGAFIANW